ncbi:type IV pilus twitching motility protein PilT [Vibrio breoganii]
MSNDFSLAFATSRIDGNLHFDQILEHMVKHNASDAFIMIGDKIWMNINKLKHPVTPRSLQQKEVESIITKAVGSTAAVGRIGSGERIDSVYEISQQVIENDIPTKTRQRFRINGVQTTTNAQATIGITIRKIESTPPTVEQIQVEQNIVDITMSSRKGLVLVAGATGSGKSTLMAALISHSIAQPDGHHHVVSIGHPIEYVYNDCPRPTSIVNQIQVGAGFGVNSFSEGLENAMRMAPTIIEVGETRDKGTAEASLAASNTGHLVYTTLHANTVASIVERFLSFFESDAAKKRALFNLIEETRVFIAQDLAKTVDGKVTAVKEYLILTDEVRDFLYTDTSNITKTVSEAVNKWGQSFAQDIQAKLDDGIISEREALRLSGN